MAEITVVVGETVRGPLVLALNERGYLTTPDGKAYLPRSAWRVPATKETTNIAAAKAAGCDSVFWNPGRPDTPSDEGTREPHRVWLDGLYELGMRGIVQYEPRIGTSAGQEHSRYLADHPALIMHAFPVAEPDLDDPGVVMPGLSASVAFEGHRNPNLKIIDAFGAPIYADVPRYDLLAPWMLARQWGHGERRAYYQSFFDAAPQFPGARPDGTVWRIFPMTVFVRPDWIDVPGKIGPHLVAQHTQQQRVRIPVIEAFQSGAIADAVVALLVRYEALAAVFVEGATGIAYETNAYLGQDPPWDVGAATATAMGEVNALVDAHQDILAAAPWAGSVFSDSTDVRLDTRMVDGKLYVFAYNTDPNPNAPPKTVRFSIGGGLSIVGNVQRLEQAGTIAPSGNTFTDTFAYLAVHLYRLELGSSRQIVIEEPHGVARPGGFWSSFTVPQDPAVSAGMEEPLPAAGAGGRLVYGRAIGMKLRMAHAYSTLPLPANTLRRLPLSGTRTAPTAPFRPSMWVAPYIDDVEVVVLDQFENVRSARLSNATREVIEANQGTVIVHYWIRVPGTPLVWHWWSLGYDQADFMLFRTFVVNSDESYTEAQWPCRGITLRSRMRATSYALGWEGAEYTGTGGDGWHEIHWLRSSAQPSGVLIMSDRNAIRLYGVMAGIPDAPDATRQARVDAAMTAGGEVEALSAWGDEFGPEFVGRPEINPAFADNPNIRIVLNGVKQLRPTPFESWAGGLNSGSDFMADWVGERRLNTGLSTGYAVNAICEATGKDWPRTIAAARTQVFRSLLGRHTIQLYADGNRHLIVENHATSPRFITIAQEMDYRPAISEYRHGKTLNTPEQRYGFGNYDVQHYVPHGEQVYAALTGDPMALWVLNVWADLLKSELIPYVGYEDQWNYRGVLEHDRGLGRPYMQMAWMHWIFGREDVRSWFMRRWADDLARRGTNFWPGPVKTSGYYENYVNSGAPDAGPPFWRPAFEFIAAAGLMAAGLEFGDRTMVDKGISWARVAFTYGTRYVNGQLQIPWGVHMPDRAGTPLTPQQMLDNRYFDYGGGDWDLWAYAGLRMAADLTGDEAMDAAAKNLKAWRLDPHPNHLYIARQIPRRLTKLLSLEEFNQVVLQSALPADVV